MRTPSWAGLGQSAMLLVAPSWSHGAAAAPSVRSSPSTGGKFLPAPRMQEEPPRSTLPQTHLRQQTAPSQLLGQRQGVSDKDIPLRQHHWGWGRGLGIPHPPASPVTGAAGSVFLLPVTTVSLCPAAQDSLSGSQPGAAPLGGATGRARGRGWLPPCPLEFAVWG